MKLLTKINAKKGQVALLVDPEKSAIEADIKTLMEKANFAKIDFIFVGGSTVTRNELEHTVALIKKYTQIPVLLFPGSSNQVTNKADGLLFLNLISGRNPDFLIGHQVACAEEVFEMGIEVIPTAYMLIDGGKMTSVAYVSQTTPIPRDQISIALKTATAGYLMGQKITFLDAGSGAMNTVPEAMIRAINAKLDGPIIVGGGVRNTETVLQLVKAGANIVVIGNKIEEEVDFLLDIATYQTQNER